jgi:hypothetical protein
MRVVRSLVLQKVLVWASVQVKWRDGRGHWGYLSFLGLFDGFKAHAVCFRCSGVFRWCGDTR